MHDRDQPILQVLSATEYDAGVPDSSAKLGHVQQTLCHQSMANCGWPKWMHMCAVQHVVYLVYLAMRHLLMYGMRIIIQD